MSAGDACRTSGVSEAPTAGFGSAETETGVVAADCGKGKTETVAAGVVIVTGPFAIAAGERGTGGSLADWKKEVRAGGEEVGDPTSGVAAAKGSRTAQRPEMPRPD